MTDIITLIQSAILIIAAFLVLLAAYGILKYKDDIENIIYARIHILGVADTALILALLAINEPLLAVAYFILVPFAAHAVANGYFYGEEEQ
ncbi:energy-converting hydrogenase B, subunit C [Methanobacterium lacus]|uniref:Energy-converting hydrogenase B, subunit C n=1 Tax=Methanobacterium lacus (strain AL-21) TaxID=877455 RepID=F0T8A1_METLA|nr:cation:proton antiporter [Methanobacterium lacus]ADZ08513.1 energy-converting hydrogenase B, subunit C [Methanobacterium lacus]MTK63452.1 cation:proton antiporter [Methanobacterium sp.]